MTKNKDFVLEFLIGSCAGIALVAILCIFFKPPYTKENILTVGAVSALLFIGFELRGIREDKTK